MMDDYFVIGGIGILLGGYIFIWYIGVYSYLI